MPFSHRRNFEQIMRREPAQRLPFSLPLTPPVARHVLEKRRGVPFDTTFRDLYPAYPDEPGRWERAYAQLGVELPDEAEVSRFGFVHLKPPPETLGAATHLREMMHPLQTVNDVSELESLPWPDVEDPRHYAALGRRVRQIEDEDRVAVGQCACSLFESAWYLRGMDQLFFDLTEDHPVGNWLLDYFTRRTCCAVRAYGEAGVDVVFLGDDVATQQSLMMSPGFWREHLRPRLQRIIDTVRAHQRKPTRIAYHSDGALTDLVDDLIEMGIDIINPVQPECMPFDQTVQRFGDRVAFWGMVGTQTTMPFGSPGDVRGVVERCADAVRQGAAMVVAPTHVIEPDVPWENLVALVDVVADIDLRAGNVSIG